MSTEILDVVPDAADAELSEVGEVLSNLRRVQVELLRQRLRRDAADAGSFESGQAAQVHRQAVGRQLGDRIDDLADGRSDFVRLLHKARIVAERSSGRETSAIADHALMAQTRHGSSDRHARRFQPYVPASQSPAEFTVRAILLGAFFGLIFGASTVYLGLRAGLTVSASIPIAVLAISVLKRLGGSTILENNIVQTIGSAGESVAAGVVFTVPALIFFGARGPVVLQLLPDHRPRACRGHPRRADDGASPSRPHRQGTRHTPLPRRHCLRGRAHRRGTWRRARAHGLRGPGHGRALEESLLDRPGVPTAVGGTRSRGRASCRTPRSTWTSRPSTWVSAT